MVVNDDLVQMKHVLAEIAYSLGCILQARYCTWCNVQFGFNLYETVCWVNTNQVGCTIGEQIESIPAHRLAYGVIFKITDAVTSH